MFYRRSFLYRALDAFFRHRWLFLLSTSCVIVLVVAFAATRKSSYSVGYTVLIDSRTVGNPLSNDAPQGGWDLVMQTTNHLQSLLATSEFLKSALINPDGSGIGLHHPINLDDPNELTELRNSISINAMGSDSFSFGVVNGDAHDADLICKSLIQTFVNRSAEEKSSYYSEQVAFIGQQVEQYKKSLAVSEDALSEFKRKNVNNMPSQQEAIEQNLITFQTQEQELQTQLASSMIRQSFLQKELAQTPQKVVANQTYGDSPLDTRLKAMQAELTDDIAVKQMKETHPAVVDLKEKIARLTKQIVISRAHNAKEANGITSTDMQPNPEYQALQSQLVDAQSQSQEAQSKLAMTQMLLSRAESGAQAVPAAERSLANLTRNYASDERTYDTLLGRLQEATMSEQLNLKQQRAAYEVLLTSPPQSLQSGKKTFMLLFGGVFLALIIGSALVVLSEWLDQSLRDPIDAQRALGLPVMAVLPEAGMLRYGVTNNRLPGSTATRWLRGGLRELPGTGGAGAVSAASDESEGDENAGKKDRKGRFSLGGFPARPSTEEAAS